MNNPSISGNEIRRSSQVSQSSSLVNEAVFSVLSVLGLIGVLFASASVCAQSGPMDSPPIGSSAPPQYKPGKTPTGQTYGIIKEGEPHKSEAAKKSDRSDEKQGAKPTPGSFTDRDPRETNEGSGPDPFGRY